MYSTCLFCNRSLGANELVEHFPVGRRLAFDSSKGRLWAVCRGCGRWNLSPLDERWEAIEECERLFEGTRLRASSDQIGLARLPEGLELVRIGVPLRPEFAAWRYGDQFGKRRQRMMLRLGGVAVLTGVVVGTHGFGLLAAGSFPAGLWQLPNFIHRARQNNRIVARGVDDQGTPYTMRGKHLGKAVLVRGDDELRLDFAHEKGRSSVRGDEAMRVGGLVLARINANGAGKADVQKAVGRIESAGGPDALLAGQTGTTLAPTRRHWSQWDVNRRTTVAGGLRATDGVTRLALEMALNEENERRALEGELATLAEEWKSAEEIARISDDMFLPESVNARLEALHEEDAHRGEPSPARDAGDR